MNIRRFVCRVLYVVGMGGIMLFLGFAFGRAIIAPSTTPTTATDIAVYFGAACILFVLVGEIIDPD
jgi:hypothetical protein